MFLEVSEADKALVTLGAAATRIYPTLLASVKSLLLLTPHLALLTFR